jgi:hypothetical protein
MANQTVTRAVECDLEPDRIYDVLADASNIPKWAPVFADSLEEISELRFRVMKNGEDFDLEVFLHPSAGAVDYVREMPNGRRGGAYIRVIPRPLGGSTICMTVPVGPNAAEAEVGKVVEKELAALIQMGQRESKG